MKTGWPYSLPLTALVGSFLIILLCVLLTSPARNIGYGLVFFASLAVFLISLGHLIVHLRRGTMTKLNRLRVIIVSVAIVLAAMFKSAQSLGWADGLLLIAATLGVLFYIGRRA
ncbi:MAG: hypothetical protein WD877_01405 [Candidatus Saccharimonadales bacterium]